MNKLKDTHPNFWIINMKDKLPAQEDKSKEFLLEFFKYTKIKDENGVLTISDVPTNFEKFVGKKSPYKFVFDIKIHNKVKDSELIIQGSYFLLAIRDYLGDKGQTNLLKINTIPELLEIKNNSKLKTYNLSGIIPDKLAFLYEFSFLSTYQYLNCKKQSVGKVLIKDKEILDFNLKEYSIQNGNKNEFLSLDLQDQYKLAKTKLNELTTSEIKPIKLILKEKLAKELFRITDHYHKQIKEKDEEVESCINKIKLLQGKLRHTSYQRDIDNLRRMIREANERLEMLKKKSYKERLKAEENFHINDEIEKHALLIKSNLINITVYYYSTYKLQVSKNGKKTELSYDPILKKLV